MFSNKFIRIKNYPSAFAEKNLLYVREIGMMPSERAGKVVNKNLDFFLIMLVNHGEGIIKYDGFEYKAKEGQCIFIDCRREYFYKCCSDNPWEVLWLKFNGKSAEFFFNEFIEKNRFIFYPASFKMINDILREMILVNSCHSEKNEVLNNKYITDILTHLITEYCFPGLENEADFKIRPIKKYIDVNFADNISLDDLAEHFYMSKYCIAREFKKIYEMTIFQYITLKRIELAKHLLIHTDDTVGEISMQCGFHDQGYFARQFKKIEGVTCLSYRKNK